MLPLVVEAHLTIDINCGSSVRSECTLDLIKDALGDGSLPQDPGGCVGHKGRAAGAEREEGGG